MSSKFACVALWGWALSSVLWTASAALALTGICPDGSIFIVRDGSHIPCPGAKQVDPNEVPPLNPEMLPRPYSWEVFDRQNDPNNPYNMVDAAPHPEAANAGQGHEPAPAEEPPRPEERQNATLPPVALAPPSLEVGLSGPELEALGRIVDLMQERAPATLVRDGAEGLAEVRLARSASFEARLHEALERFGAPARGPVLLLRAIAGVPDRFYGNLTFVQGHLAFHPDTGNPAQFGVLEGELGELAAGGQVLAYAVLPEHVDLAEPLDIYWDDRRIRATLAN
ncbi:MAG: hypothetical protein AAEJ53_05810 [Myxococcota bacterium]